MDVTLRARGTCSVRLLGRRLHSGYVVVEMRPLREIASDRPVCVFCVADVLHAGLSSSQQCSSWSVPKGIKRRNDKGIRESAEVQCGSVPAVCERAHQRAG